MMVNEPPAYVEMGRSLGWANFDVRTPFESDDDNITSTSGDVLVDDGSAPAVLVAANVSDLPFTVVYAGRAYDAATQQTARCEVLNPRFHRDFGNVLLNVESFKSAISLGFDHFLL